MIIPDTYLTGDLFMTEIRYVTFYRDGLGPLVNETGIPYSALGDNFKFADRETFRVPIERNEVIDLKLDNSGLMVRI